MRNWLKGAGVALAMLGASAAATAAELSMTPITGFTVSNVTSVLTKLGAENVTTGKSSENEDIIRFEAGGIKYAGLIRACGNGHGCLGLLLGVPVLLEQGTFSADLVNNFNDASPFGKAVRVENGKAVVLFHYVIADGGILESNLGANIAVFSILPGAFAKFASQQVVASAEKPQVLPVTAPKPAIQLPMGLKPSTGGEHGSLTSSLKAFEKEPAYKLPQ